MRLLNVDPAFGGGTPDALTLALFDGVVFTARPQLKPYLDSLLNQGKVVVLTIGKESGDPSQYAAWRATGWVIGNEPTTVSPSSWTMTVPQYDALWQSCRVLQGPRWVAGMADGDPLSAAPYLQTDAAGLAIHLYTLSAADAAERAREYAALGVPILIHEWHPQRTPAQPGDLDPYWSAFGDLPNAYFCYADAMVAGMGLPSPIRRQPVALNVSAEMTAKLAALGDHPILDSVFLTNQDGTGCEKTQGTKGVYLSSEADGWALRGPFGATL